MSFLLDPFLLVGAGMVGARIAKSRRVWKRDSFFVWWWNGITISVFYLFSIALFVDPALHAWWTRWLWAWTGARDGLDFMVNSGIFEYPTAWPIADAGLLAFSIVMFVSYPFFLWLGTQLGYILFGRHPRQTGAIGLF